MARVALALVLALALPLALSLPLRRSITGMPAAV